MFKILHVAATTREIAAEDKMMLLSGDVAARLSSPLQLAPATVRSFSVVMFKNVI
jgi:hypothetical protein